RDPGGIRALLRSPRGGADPQRLPARPREAPEHGAQPALAVPARPMHGAGTAHAPRRGEGIRGAATTTQGEKISSRQSSLHDAAPALTIESDSSPGTTRSPARTRGRRRPAAEAHSFPPGTEPKPDRTRLARPSRG